MHVYLHKSYTTFKILSVAIFGANCSVSAYASVAERHHSCGALDRLARSAAEAPRPRLRLGCAVLREGPTQPGPKPRGVGPLLQFAGGVVAGRSTRISEPLAAARSVEAHCVPIQVAIGWQEVAGVLVGRSCCEHTHHAEALARCAQVDVTAFDDWIAACGLDGAVGWAQL